MSGNPPDLSPLEVLRAYPSHDYTLDRALLSRTGIEGGRPFLMDGVRRRSWKETCQITDRAAAALAKGGIVAGDRVCIMAQNSESHAILLFALARLRAILVPVNPQFGIDEAGYIFVNAAVSAIACQPEMVDVVQQACQARGIAPWLFMLDDFLGGDITSLEALFDGTGNPPVSSASPDDTCLIIYTSGTTGFPKGVMHSQRTFLLAGEFFLDRMRLQPDDRLLIVLPMFHINALLYSLSGAIAAGCTAIIEPRFSASTFWKLAEETGATEVNVIEAMGNILATRSRSEYVPTHHIVKAYGVRPAAAKVFKEEFGVKNIVSGYGMTEVLGVLSPPFDADGKPGGIGILGRHPDPSVPRSECRILDDAGRDVPPGETGELAVKTPVIMQGYFRDERQTAEAFHEGWFLTGDLVRQEGDGSYYFVSRKKDIIRKKGNNIAGAELDRVIGQHPDVYEVATVAVPSELGEDEILAAVVAKSGSRLVAEDIVAWCAARLEPIKMPRFILFVDELPHTPTHKIAKNVLKADPTLRARAVDRLEGAANRRG